MWRTASIAFPDDLLRKAQKAKETKGSKFLHIYASLPHGLAHPLRNVRQDRPHGRPRPISFPSMRWKTVCATPSIYKPKEYLVREYFKLQGRFKHLTDQDLDQIQQMVNEDWRCSSARLVSAPEERQVCTRVFSLSEIMSSVSDRGFRFF